MSSIIVVPGEKKLRPVCKALGLPQKGSKAELVKRLTEHGLTLQEIVFRATTNVAPTKSHDLAEQFRNLKHQNPFYSTALPTSIYDVPGEKALRKICKQFGLKQFGNKVDLIKSLVDHGLTFDKIVDMTETPPLFEVPATSEQATSSFMDGDDEVMDTLPPPPFSEPMVTEQPSGIECADQLPLLSEMTTVSDEPLPSSAADNFDGDDEVMNTFPPPPFSEPMVTEQPSGIECADQLPLLSEITTVSDEPLPSSAADNFDDFDDADALIVPAESSAESSASLPLSASTFVCSECGKGFAQKRYLQAHIKRHRLRKPKPPPPPPSECNLCGRVFAQKRYMNAHIKLTHNVVEPNDYDGTVITLNEAKDGFECVAFNDKIHRETIYHIVCIPWFDMTGTHVNLSVGFSHYADITYYAKNIWRQIKKGIDDGNLYLSGCGSGRMAVQRLNWEMHPEKSFAIEICSETQVIANRVKGYIRELLDSVYINSANDKNGFLRPRVCIIINEKVRNALHNMSAHNANAFDANLNGTGQHSSFRLNVTANRKFNFDVLDDNF